MKNLILILSLCFQTFTFASENSLQNKRLEQPSNIKHSLSVLSKLILRQAQISFDTFFESLLILQLKKPQSIVSFQKSDPILLENILKATPDHAFFFKVRMHAQGHTKSVYLIFTKNLIHEFYRVSSLENNYKTMAAKDFKQFYSLLNAQSISKQNFLKYFGQNPWLNMELSLQNIEIELKTCIVFPLNL